MTSKSKPNLKASLASPSTKTPTLKDTLTLPDCANELSKLTSQTYTADAVLDLVLDGKLTPYLDFVQPLLAIQFSVENINQSDGLLGGIPISRFQQLVVPEPADSQHLKSIKNITGLYQLTPLGATEFGERAEGGGTHWIKMQQARIRGDYPIPQKQISPPILLHKSTGTYYAPAMAEHIEGLDAFYVLDSEIPASATLRFLSSEINALAPQNHIELVHIQTTDKAKLKAALIASKESKLLFAYAKFEGASATKNQKGEYKFAGIKDFMKGGSHTPMPGSDNTVRRYLKTALDGYDRKVKLGEPIPKAISDLGMWQQLVKE